MRNDKKRILDTLKSINSRGYDPYNKSDALGWMYSLKWQDDCRRRESRSEYTANMTLAEMDPRDLIGWIRRYE